MKYKIYVYIIIGLLMSITHGFVGSASAIEISKLVVVASNSTPTTEVTDVPMGQDENPVSLLPEDAEIVGDQNIFGLEGGYFHPYITVQGEFSDNLYNVNRDETDNFLTRISPGIWFSLPRKKIIPITITPHNTSPGGLQNQLKDQDSTDRYMAYALAGLDFKYYSENSELDEVDGVAEGLLRYNMRGGLSLHIVDRYTKNQDKFGFETLDREIYLARFDSNYLMATADWALTEKLRLKLDYSNFFLDYDEVADNYKNRVDNAIDFYGYFNYSVKTSFFLQYKVLDVSYDVATQNDSEQEFLYGGMKWDSTEKLAFLLKAGYQDRTFDNDAFREYNGLALDFQTTYRYSEKTNMNLSFYRANEETDSTVASDKTVFGLSFDYKQKFTEKINGSINFKFEDANYNQLVTQERDEQTYFFRPALQYLFREWLRGEIAYSYEEVISTDEIFEYQTNVFLVNLSLAI